jgi:ribonuclease inhibitor
MTYIALDFTGIKTPWELHEYFKEVFRLPDYYGHNMDALWDCLYCCYDSSTTIVLKKLSAIPGKMQEEVKIMLELFRELDEKDEVTVVIEAADGGVTDISDYPA